MKIAIISVSADGAALSAKIADSLNCECDKYIFDKGNKKNAYGCFSDIGEIAGRCFPAYDALVFVCACGIAVRAIAPYIRSKTTDPAVVVIDDCGRFAVPILSGHIGGANRLAKVIAERNGAQAVITTATDARELFSPDSFAKANDLIIENMDAAKEIAAELVDGGKIGLYSELQCVNIPKEITARNTKTCRAGIAISSSPKPNMFEVTLNLIPKNIVIGVGCKSGVSAKTIEQRVFGDLQNTGIDIRRVRVLATIDIKSDEAGLLEFARIYGLQTVFFSAAELMSVDGDFTSSEFVKNTTGADNICERAAAGCGGRLIIRKTMGEGVTVAAAELPVTVDFQKEIFL